MEFWVSYGITEVPVRVPDNNFYRVLEPEKPDQGPHDFKTILEDGIDNPIGNMSLPSIVRPGGVSSILVDPAIPSPILNEAIEILRSRLSSLGADEVQLLSRARSTIPIVRHGLRMIKPDTGTFMDLGVTRQGTPVAVDQEFQSSRVRILLGIVQSHFASGFTGGPDLVVPGASSLKTIEANRRLLISARPDQTDNPVYQDSLEAAKMLGPLLLVTIVLDKWGRASHVYSGELESTFKQAMVQHVKENSLRLETRPEIIVVSSDGPYYSTDLYHAIRILPLISNIQKRDGSTIILAGECRNGVGDASFLKYSKENDDVHSLESDLKRHGFKLGGHVALTLKRALEKSRVQLVSVIPDVYTRAVGLKPSRTVTAGVQSAIRVEGKDAKILIIPKASSIIPSIETSTAQL